MPRSSDWESAYKGKMVEVARTRPVSRSHQALSSDLSEGKLMIFYGVIASAVVLYFVYINQDKIRDLFFEKAPQAQRISQMATGKK